MNHYAGSFTGASAETEAVATPRRGYRLLLADDEFRDLAGRGADLLELGRAGARAGTANLNDDAFDKVAGGPTCLDEVMRRLGPRSVQEPRQ